MPEKVRVAIAGTSWWASEMYLPALSTHPLADLRAVAGTRLENTRDFASQWGIPKAYDSAEEMIAAEPLDAVIVATPNYTHYELVRAAIDRGLHVICEKPVGMTSLEARRLADLAATKAVITMVPFTYRHMPGMRYLKELVDSGYIGQPYHLAMRMYSGYARTGEYLWRFDAEKSGAGVVADLGSHLADYARWYFGDIESATAEVSRIIPRADRPDGSDYPRADDSATVVLRFANGATGILDVTYVAYEPSALYDQRHEIELHGSEGTIHHINDWNDRQDVFGARVGDAGLHELPIPDACWGGAPREHVLETFQHVFRHQDTQGRAFVSAVAAGRPVKPDLADGLAAQRVVEAAVRSAREGRRVTIAEVEAEEA